MSEIPVSLFKTPELAPLLGSSGRAPVARGRCELLGMPINAVTESEALEILDQRITRGQGTWVLTPNLDILRQYVAFPSLRPLFHAEQGGADLLLADGMPLLWATRLARRPLPERVPGSGLVLTLAQRAARRGWRLFLLGGAPGAAERAARILAQDYPGLDIAGTCCPPQGFEKDPEQLAAVRRQVSAARPDLVFVALGFPKQELLIQQLRHTLPNATFIGVGISLSFIAGDVKRAPRWLQRSGLEWVHRLVQEPRRLARRYLVHDAPFALFHLFPRALAHRWTRRSGREESWPGPRGIDRRAFAPVDPFENSEGSTDEGSNPRRRPGHTPEPPDQGDQQAPPAGLRQADDPLSHRMPEERWDH